GIGNIGAYMKADINVILDVDPNEAQLLIELVELLFGEWYVARAARTERLGKLKAIAADKKEQKQAPPLSSEKNQRQPKKRGSFSGAPRPPIGRVERRRLRRACRRQGADRVSAPTRRLVVRRAGACHDAHGGGLSARHD